MGYADKSKEFQIYWPIKHLVTAERNVYLNKNEVLLPNNIRIEEENDKSTSSNIADSFSHSNINTEPNNIKLHSMNDDNENNFKISKNIKNNNRGQVEKSLC